MKCECFQTNIFVIKAAVWWPRADIWFFSISVLVHLILFLFVFFNFLFFYFYFFFLDFFIMIFLIFISFHFYYFISFHFIFSFHFFSLFETKSNKMRIKSKQNQMITMWPRADIAPKINHDSQELTYAWR